MTLISLGRRLKIPTLSILLLLSACGDTTPAQHLKQAEEALAKGDVRLAVIELKTVLQSEPNNMQARLLLGHAYVEAGDWASGEKELLRAGEMGAGEVDLQPWLAKTLLEQGRLGEVQVREIPEGASNQLRGNLLAIKAEAWLRSGENSESEKLAREALDAVPNLAPALLTMARLHGRQGQIPEMREWIAKALAADPKFGAAWELLGYIETRESHFEAAEEAYSKAAQDPILRASALVARAMARIQLKKYDEAAADIDQAGKRLKDSAGLHFARGLLNFEQKRLAEAQEAFDAALAVDSSHFPSLLYGGATHGLLGHKAQAEDYLRKYLSHDPSNVKAQSLLVHLEVQNSDPANAEKLAREALKQAPNDVQVMNLLSDALKAQGKKGESIEYLKQVVTAQPESVEAHTRLAGGLIQEDNLQGAMGELKKALEIDPEFEGAVRGVVTVHLHKGELKQALDVAIDYLKRHPDSAGANALVGLVHLVGRETDKASAALRRAIELDPANVPATNALAAIAVQEKDFEKARRYFQQALKHHPNDIGVLTNLAKLEATQGNTEAMASTLEDAVKRDPKALLPRLYLGRHYLKAKNAKKTIELLSEVRSTYPESKELLGMLAEAELAAGRWSDALSSLKSLESLGHKKPEVHFLMAQAYDRLGDRKMARDALEKTEAEDPSFIPARIALVRMAVQEKRTKDAETRVKELKKRFGEGVPEIILVEAELAELAGNYSQAASAYRRLFELAPPNKTSINLLRLTRALWQAGEKEGALQELEQWVELHPDDTLPQAELAQLYMKLQRPQDAVAKLKVLAEKSPHNALVFNNIAYLLREIDPVEALRHAEKAQSLAPESAEVLDTLAMTLLSNKEGKRAMANIDRALAQQPENISFLFHRAQILNADGQPQEAAKILDKILQKGGKFAERSDAEAMRKRLASSL
ncbi:XrtA/PEP-CTERM system TPR-repeat protein PrsT [Methylocaldum sp.]|uniref:XrtA/PEP-CTERM system TPR-repeat protein PrsT n=1 Tax=Methylocaldum sp. TaxID=1969727 RepID=UPI002D3B6E19|nr:XrtA/PEP-CTERM system TPR-repeat protein PrsT [Methylocaldum sp.]HYE34699.1 XrtA/PEP-CTERM system TPR-repeat protein PrsT [Methylocaldum sp.]